MDELLSSYNAKKNEIQKRLEEFREARSEEGLFAELVFCILTPQSKAYACDRAVRDLFESRVIFSGNARAIESRLKSKVRFHRTKAGHIIKARDFILVNGIKGKISGEPAEVREWLVKNVYGLGYKEASHFLRNIGLGEELAILDRHILKNLVRHGVIKEIPKTMTRKKYFEIEESMKKFSEKVGIPISHLDLLLWSEETGKIFK
ncbi:MAG: N-glycosylase/DNA lyase [Candidatus Aenigmarchaeota archaeon]|nr:N-glycosylase/DNA lyase [Candidatus Aenigmarchaeota archaeon]